MGAAARHVWLATLLFIGTQAEAGGLPDYPSESELLVDTPGTAQSLAAGLFNPAGWAMQRDGGIFFAWEGVKSSPLQDDYTGVLSLKYLGFGFRQFRFEPGPGESFRLRDYSLGLSMGNQAHTLGLSYGWGGGSLEQMERHERFTVGSVSRMKAASLGLAWTRDLEANDNFLQADLGIRPMGPRLTLFGDAVYEHGQSWGDIRTGYGAEFKVFPGVSLAGKARSTGEFAFRIGLALERHGSLDYRSRFDDDGGHGADVVSLEIGPPRAALLPHVAKGTAYPSLSLRGPMRYQRYRWFDNGRTFLGTLGQVEALADAPQVGGVVVNLSGAQMSAEMFWEMRQQLSGLRGRGKKVIVYVDRAGMFTYMLASVADEIWMDQEGSLDLRGLALGRTYMRGTFDKLGIGVDEWRFFTYKSAFESYSRTSMSEPDREQRQALVDDFYETAAAAITGSRSIERARWDELVNERGVFLAEEARSMGLVDSIGSFQQAQKAARRLPQPSDGAMALARVTGDPKWRAEEWGEPPRIAVLYAIGLCDMETGIRGRVLSEKIRQAREDPRVKAVVLRADSPGGDPLPSDLVAREIRETAKRKPVIVSQGQVAASGGYWISMYGNRIVASPLSITGSIGVIAGFLWNDGFGEKTGFSFDSVQRGEHADFGQGIRLPFLGLMLPERPPTAKERQRAEELIRSEYGAFVDAVAKSRGLQPSYVDSIGQGRVWSGTRGKRHGLVDEIGGLWRSLAMAKAAAGLDADETIEFVEAPDRGAFDWSFLQPRLPGFSAESKEGVLAPTGVPADVAAFLTPAERDSLQRLLRAGGRPIFMMEPMEIQSGDSEP